MIEPSGSFGAHMFTFCFGLASRGHARCRFIASVALASVPPVASSAGTQSAMVLFISLFVMSPRSQGTLCCRVFMRIAVLALAFKCRRSSCLQIPRWALWLLWVSRQDGSLMARGGPVFRSSQMSRAERERERGRDPSSPPDAAPTSHH